MLHVLHSSSLPLKLFSRPYALVSIKLWPHPPVDGPAPATGTSLLNGFLGDPKSSESSLCGGTSTCLASILSILLTFFLLFLLALARLFGSYSSGRQRLPGGLTWLRYHAAECAPFSLDTKGLPSRACLCCLHDNFHPCHALQFLCFFLESFLFFPNVAKTSRQAKNQHSV